MKKLLILALVLMLAMTSLVACNNGETNENGYEPTTPDYNEEQNNEPEPPPEPTPTPEPEPAPAPAPEQTPATPAQTSQSPLSVSNWRANWEIEGIFTISTDFTSLQSIDNRRDDGFTMPHLWITVRNANGNELQGTAGRHSAGNTLYAGRFSIEFRDFDFGTAPGRGVPFIHGNTYSWTLRARIGGTQFYAPTQTFVFSDYAPQVVHSTNNPTITFSYMETNWRGEFFVFSGVAHVSPRGAALENSIRITIADANGIEIEQGGMSGRSNRYGGSFEHQFRADTAEKRFRVGNTYRWFAHVDMNGERFESPWHSFVFSPP